MPQYSTCMLLFIMLLKSILLFLSDFNAVVNQIEISDINSVNLYIKTLTVVLNEVVSILFSKTIYTNIESKPRLSANQVCKKAGLFDEECQTPKQAYFNVMKSFNSCNTYDNKINMFNIMASYKQLVKQKKRSFEGNKIRGIEKLRHAKPMGFLEIVFKKEEKCLKHTNKWFFKIVFKHA